MTYALEQLARLSKDQNIQLRERKPQYQGEWMYRCIDVYEKGQKVRSSCYPLTKEEYEQYKGGAQ